MAFLVFRTKFEISGKNSLLSLTQCPWELMFSLLFMLYTECLSALNPEGPFLLAIRGDS